MDSMKERNYGIDLLRVLAMFFVIVLHCFGRGGILYNVFENTSHYKVAWLMEIIAYSAVDIFALISGYVCYKEKNNKLNVSRFINLWCQVVFYGIAINLFFNLFHLAPTIKGNYVLVLFPLSNNLYWYFTAYTGVLLIMPLINNGIKNTDNSVLIKMFVAMLLMFSLLPILFNIFSFEGGYSFAWILVLYIMGAIIKKCDIGKNVNSWLLIVGIIVLTLITYLYKMYGFTKEITPNVLITKDLLISYCSPTVLGSAILYVILFSKMKFNNISKKVIAFASVSSFSIYIINNHSLVWDNVMDSIFVDLASGRLRFLILYPLLFALIFVVGSILVDKIRIIIFKLLHIDNICNFLDKKVNSSFCNKEPLK